MKAEIPATTFRGGQRKFEKGDIFTKYKNFMGYTCVYGEIAIVPEQA